MKTHDFPVYLARSKGQAQIEDRLTIKAMLAGCVSVEPSSELLDKAGVDYVATLRCGSQVLIDSKTRQLGCSKYWTHGPELALEIWSVCPNGKYQITGWTLCEKKTVDLILFKFDPQDCPDVFLISFQLLRIAFRRNFHCWKKEFQSAIQINKGYKSECLYVPVEEVFKAIDAVSRGHLVQEAAQTQHQNTQPVI